MEQERASIAREIHDDIGGSMAAANLDLAWVNRHTTDTAVLRASDRSHGDASTRHRRKSAHYDEFAASYS